VVPEHAGEGGWAAGADGVEGGGGTSGGDESHEGVGGGEG